MLKESSFESLNISDSDTSGAQQCGSPGPKRAQKGASCRDMSNSEKPLTAKAQTFVVNGHSGINLASYRTERSQSLFRRLLVSALFVLGAGYALNSVPVILMFHYRFSQLSLSSFQNVLAVIGMLLIMFASVIFIALGVLVVVGAIKYSLGDFSRGIVVVGVFLGSLYLLCLGVGSVLLISESSWGAVLLTVSPMLFMTAIACHASSTRRAKLVGSVVGLLGGIIFTLALSPAFRVQIFKLVFTEWDVLVPGPFMSMAVVEGPALAVGSLAALFHSMLDENGENPVKYALYPIAALVYGFGMVIGPLVLSLSFLNLLWKAPWLGPLHNAPDLISSTITFWSASLVILIIGGILLILASLAGFYHALSTAKE
ncbi:MAG: hypothetical protein GTO14_06080 [Anaerolineales bacterium]|nr:hypothetical protein [Anaerolineales bacterium]